MRKQNLVILVIIIIVLIIFIAVIFYGNRDHYAIESIIPGTSVGNQFNPDISIVQTNSTSISNEIDKPVTTEQISVNASKDYMKIGTKVVGDCLTYMFGGDYPYNFVQTLGEPEKKVNDRWYFKQDVEIDVVVDGHLIGNYVYIGNGCSLKTDRGIGIGSHYNDVKQAYKDEINPGKTTKNIIIVGDGWTGINFVIKDNCVTSMYISEGSMTQEYFGEFTPDRP